MNRCFLLFLLFPAIINAQFIENWSSGDFYATNLWIGDHEKFTLNTELYQLDLTAPEIASYAYLSTTSKAINNASWTFSIEMDFNPSSSNYAIVYLCANQDEFNEDLEGYFVKIGDTNDEVSLWRRKDGTNSKIIDGQDKILDNSTNTVFIKAERDELGNWILYSKLADNKYDIEGEVFDDEIIESKYYMIYTKYTSTRSTKVHFGEIIVTGDSYIDSDSPKLNTHELINGKHIQLNFNEEILDTSYKSENFTFTNQDVSISQIFTNQQSIEIYLTDYLNDIENGLIQVNGIQDLSENTINDTMANYYYERLNISQLNISSANELQIQFSKAINGSSINLENITGLDIESFLFSNDSIVTLQTLSDFVSGAENNITISHVATITEDEIKSTSLKFTYYKPNRYDIVFSEIMTDPSPQVGLPAVEYIELFNNTDHSINLENFKLHINTNESTLPNYQLNSNTYVLIYDESEMILWDETIPNIEISNLASLTNSSGELILYDSNNHVYDAIRYPFGEKEVTFKDDGGWSLERIDNENYELSVANWDFSIHSNGGTPGQENSLIEDNPDISAPIIKQLSYINSHEFEIVFNEAMDTTTWLITPPITIDSVNTAEFETNIAFLDRISLQTSSELNTGIIYPISLNENISDYAKNKIYNQFQWQIGVPEYPDSFDVCINEILFNPVTESTDFVEIYNRSDKIINLSDLYLCSLENRIPVLLYNINSSNQLLMPGYYCVVAEDTATLLLHHTNITKQLLCESNIPSLNDDEGNIAIASNNGLILDYFEYNENMHFELLQDNEGVSLERINTNNTTQDANNWHSASSASDFATPTAINSQYATKNFNEQDKWIWLSNETLSPNADGDKDYLQINYQFNNSGWSASIQIFDRNGRSVKTLVTNELLGTSGFLKWDGTTDTQNKATMGIYLIYAEFFSIKGEVKKEKLVCVITAGKRK